MTPSTNYDDYYSNVPKQPAGSEEEKKSGLKIKLKAKKVETEETAPADTAPAPSVSKEEETKKPDNFRPVISFEAAPKIEPLKKFDKPYVDSSRKNDRPQRPAAAPAPAQEKRPQNPNYVNPFLQKRQDDRPRKQAPRISFEAAPVIEQKPAQAPGAPSANKLESYAKSHQNAPKRGRNSLPHKKPEFSNEPNKRGKSPIREKATVEDDGTFRRTKKIVGGEKREKTESDIKQVLSDKTGQEVAIPPMLSVKEFSEKIGVPLPKIIAELMKNGMMTNLNTKIDFDTCFLIGETFQVKIVREVSTEVSVTDIMQGNIAELLKNDDPEKKTDRAPIISIMGHVDHGKTSILDYIRKTSIVDTEAGGITQKIGAYQVDRNGKKITFLDTPGHEAFSIMRSRGAKLTDLAVIVIAADEGMKPQTIESINHAKQAGIPMIVAANKMDKPGANLDLIR